VSYRVYNRSEQFLRLALPEDAKLLSVLVAGEGVRPLSEAGDLLVPLRKLALGEPTFDVDVVYAYSDRRVGSGDSRVRLPAVRRLDVRRTTLSLYVPRGFSFDFDTEMEEVSQADIAAGEATDLYQEIKELYDVAQRGNKLQAGRALSNVQQLEAENRRILDYVRENTRDSAKLQQVESQERALGRLRQSTAAVEGKGGAPAEQAAARGIESWGVNEAFLRRAGVEQRKQVDEFRAKQQQAAQGGYQTEQTLESTIWVGEPQRPAQSPAERPEAGVSFVLELEADGRMRAGEESAVGDALRRESAELVRRSVVGFLGGGQAYGELAAAKGRISLRIDLPKEGDVYHFAQLGGADGVRFDADEEDGAVLEGALAILCAAAAAFVIRFRAR
jgi:hypothetical protein